MVKSKYHSCGGHTFNTQHSLVLARMPKAPAPKGCGATVGIPTQSPLPQTIFFPKSQKEHLLVLSLSQDPHSQDGPALCAP